MRAAITVHYVPDEGEPRPYSTFVGLGSLVHSYSMMISLGINHIQVHEIDEQKLVLHTSKDPDAKFEYHQDISVIALDHEQPISFPVADGMLTLTSIFLGDKDDKRSENHK